MVYKPKRFEAPQSLEGLSPESRQLVLDARERLEAWIDENVDRLESEMNTAIDSRSQALASEVSAFEAELADAREQLGEVLARLGTLEEGFDAGDGMTVDEAVRATREAVQAVRAALEERERRIAGLSKAVASAGLKTVTGL